MANGNYQVPSSCGVGPQIPAMAFYQAQPEPTCPAPGMVRIPTEVQGRDLRNPNKSCRLDLGDIAGNTAVDSLFVMGGDEGCFSDADLREIFGVGETTPIIRPTGRVACALEHQFVEGGLTFTIEGATDSAAESQFRQNGQAYLANVTNANDDCAFKVTRDNRCSPCDNGELIQSFGSLNCSPVVVGPTALFAVTIVAGASLDDAAFCICAYSVPTWITCNSPASCPPAPPAPPICPEPYMVQSGQVAPAAFGTQRTY